MLKPMNDADMLRFWGQLDTAKRSPGFQPVKDETPVVVWYNDGVMSRYIRPAKAWRFWTGGRDWWMKPLTNDRLYIERYLVVPLNIIEQYEMRMHYNALFTEGARA